MNGIRGSRRSLPAIVVLALFAEPCTVLSQPGLDTEADLERQFIAKIEQERSRNGPSSEGLIGPLTSLALLYQEHGDRALAVAVIAQLRQLVRANYGLHSLRQAPLIRQLIANAEEMGDVRTAWDLEQELVTLARRNPDDLRSAGILREVADKRMDVLDRYLNGEMPPQVILGCYYDWSAVQGAGTCASGSKQEAVRALVSDAQRAYAEAIAVMLRNGLYSDHELRDLEMDLVRGSDLMRRRDELDGRGQDFDLALTPPFLEHTEPWRSTLDAVARLATWEIPNSSYGLRTEQDATGTDWVRSRLKDHYQLARLALQRIYAYEAASSAPLEDRVDALVQIADWDLLYSQNAQALDLYELAYGMLEHADSDSARAAIERIFSPTVPVVLPAFAPSPLMSHEGEESTKHIDIAFEITAYGEGRRIEILGVSADCTEADRDELVRLIKRSRFRPRMTEGRFTRRSPVRTRYYLHE